MLNYSNNAKKEWAGKFVKTKDGRIVKITFRSDFSIQGKIGKRNFQWMYSGNYIGSNCPHGLDIDWKKGTFTTRLKAKTIKLYSPKDNV